jgi:probable DNA repair protein
LGALVLRRALRAGLTVLTPTAEHAALLYDAVERAHRDGGDLVWPTPRIREFGSWLRELHARRQLLSRSATEGANDFAALRCLSDIEERELWREVVQDSPLADAFLEPAGAALAARRARGVMAAHGIPLAALADQPSEEAQALADWIRHFDQRCRALGCVAKDALLASFAGAPEPVTWIESPSWQPVPRRWLQSHAGAALVNPPRPESPSPGTVVKADGAAAELAALAEWAARRASSAEPFRAWICVPDLAGRREELRDALDAALAPQSFSLSATPGRRPYALAGGSPLAEHASVRAALDLLALATGVVRFERFSALVRAPEYHGSSLETSRAAALDVLLRTRAPSEQGLPAWLALTERLAKEHSFEPPEVLGRLRAALALLDALAGEHPLSHWVPIWLTAFEAGPWCHRARWSSGEHQAAERLRELLSTLASGDRLYGRRSRRSAEQLLAAAARATSFQAQTGIPPIWVSGALVDPWLDFNALWITGLSADRWPPPAEPVPLLPIGLQRQFSVVTSSADTQLAAARELQSRWARRAPLLQFSYARASAGNARDATASPLLHGAQPSSLGAEPQPHWQHAHARAPVLESIRDERGPPLAAREHPRGVASLRAQSQCAFRGFATTRLRADPLELPEPGFNASERGQLVHGVLELVWGELQSSAALGELAPEALQSLLERGITRALARVCMQRDPGPRWRARERSRLLSLMQRWLEVEAGREAFVVEGLEPGRDVMALAGIEFACRIDRIDRLADGARVLIDYKTGTKKRDWCGDRPDDPQLPLYGLLYAERLVAVAYGQVNAADCRFIAESERAGVFGPRSDATTLEGTANFQALLALWRRRLEQLAADLGSGWAQVAPTPQACERCGLQGLCRIPGSGTGSDGDAASDVHA